MPDSATQPYHGSYLMPSHLLPSLENATVGDAMHPGVLSCPADTTLSEVARMMSAHHVHALAVMGIAHTGSSESLVWGIISDLDLMRAGIGDDDTVTAGTLARQPIVDVEPTMPLRDAAQLMLEQHLSHLVVSDSEKLLPIGVLSSLDVIHVVAWGEGSASAGS